MTYDPSKDGAEMDFRQRKDDIGKAATIDVRCPDVYIAFMAENAIQCMDGFTSGASDELLMKRHIAIGHRVDFHDQIMAIVSIDCAASFARTTEISVGRRRC